VILSAGLAARRFGSESPAVKTIQIDGRAAFVIGVMPAGFPFPGADTEIWQPYTQLIPYRPPNRDADYLCVLGRLKPGVSLEQARANMAGIGERLEQVHPNVPSGFAGFGVNVVPLYEQIYGKSTRPALLLIMAVAICVLLIAVTNIANLLLARLQARDREFAVRAALGRGIDALHGRCWLKSARSPGSEAPSESRSRTPACTLSSMHSLRACRV
jgi:putative ABC transport system permease protein